MTVVECRAKSGRTLRVEMGDHLGDVTINFDGKTIEVTQRPTLYSRWDSLHRGLEAAEAATEVKEAG